MPLNQRDAIVACNPASKQPVVTTRSCLFAFRLFRSCLITMMLFSRSREEEERESYVDWIAYPTKNKNKAYQCPLDILLLMASRRDVGSRPNAIPARIARALTRRGRICNNCRNSRDRCSTRRSCNPFFEVWWRSVFASS